MAKLDIAELQLDALTKAELLQTIDHRLKSGEQTFVTTLYSEFLLAGMQDRAVRDLLNRADLAVADGVALPLAERFLQEPFLSRSYVGKILEAWVQLFWKGALILLHPASIYVRVPEKIVGADLIWDLARLAEQGNHSVFLLGGFDDTPELVQRRLQTKFPKLNVVGASSLGPESDQVLEELRLARPDLLLVAYGPLRQEAFIDAHLHRLPVKLAIGLGGTFDYVAGKRMKPPGWMRRTGLEWFFRLLTQPHRLLRIFNAVVGLAVHLVRYKVLTSLPYRANAVAVVVNPAGRVLMCQRNPIARKNSGRKDLFIDYWQFPQGGLDPQEELVEGATRELAEETNLNNVTPLGVATYTNQYDWPNANRPLLWQRFLFRGQSQRTVFFRFAGSDDEIQLDKQELVAFRWCTMAEAITLAAPERKAHAKAVLGELAEKISLE